MRTTLSIDDDIALLLAREVQRTGNSFKATVNHLLSLGLTQARQPQTPQRFTITPRPMGLGAGQSYDNISALLEELEGPERK